MTTIRDVLKSTQPETFNRLTKKRKRRKRRKRKPGEVRIDDKLAQELMRHDCYRRVGGAIKQVIHG